MDLPTLAIDFASPGFWLAVFQIIWIDILLSGDNAVVIALACRELPPRERLRGMVIGAGVAAILLVTLSAVASMLLRLRYLQLAGGVALLWIAVKLLAPQPHDEEGSREAAHDLWRAVRIIVLADIVMSLDNVVAVAAIAKGRVVLLITGLAVSIPVVFAGSAVTLWLLKRYPILVWGGAATLGWVAGGMLVTDPAVAEIRPHYTEGVASINFALKSISLGWDWSLVGTTDLVDLAAALLGAIVVVAIGVIWRATHAGADRAARRAGDAANAKERAAQTERGNRVTNG
jgi:YjbE family integral membrane protein